LWLNLVGQRSKLKIPSIFQNSPEKRPNNDRKTGIITLNQFSTKQILGIGATLKNSIGIYQSNFHQIIILAFSIYHTILKIFVILSYL